ncbi:unnamed protein product [Ectocarpus sp. CCAP 1310/34]|nr:unnamed protein product [Ectocarpus sp. CCAP 1310/34]
MIEEEAATNNPRTAADLLRGVREQVADIDPAAEVEDIDPAAEAINTLLHRVMWRYTKAHMQSTREDLSEGQLVGEDRLHEDFLAQFMTGPRRHASGILTIPKSDFGNPKIMRFLSPYVGGNDNLVVEETPAEDVHVEDSDLGAYLDEMN